MMAMETPAFLASGRSDAEDRLVMADEPLARLQHRGGGELPGMIAIPELLALVRKSRCLGLRLAQTIEAIDGDEVISAWVQIMPDGSPRDGCHIGVGSWNSAPLPPDDPVAAARRVSVINRHLAEISVRLDAEQRLLAVEGTGTDVSEIVAAMQGGIGERWTDFVTIQGSDNGKTPHWRLLNRAWVSFPGSQRRWKATLVPLGLPEPGSAGFHMYLGADEVSTIMEPTTGAGLPDENAGAVVGRDLAPVLRRPIARIIANAETIRTRLAGPLADEYTGYAADIALAGQHLLSLLDDLADLEVVEAADFTTAPDLIDLGDLARRAAGILNVRAQERGITITAPPPHESLAAIGEFRRVLQILLNLINNAIHYSPEGSQVAFHTGGVAGRTRIMVENEGEGLTRQEQARIFDKFERLGRSGDGGSGLGLYISRRLARAMGGDLSVESTPGKGARFTLELPAAE